MQSIESYEFTRNTNSLFIAAIEFIKIAREYPIVFGQNAEGKPFPVALLGITPGQNLFLNEKGEWQAELFTGLCAALSVYCCFIQTG